MSRSVFFALVGVIAMLFGVVFLSVPDVALRQYGTPAEPQNLLQARYFGAALLEIGAMVWLARHTQDAVAIRALLVGTAIGNGVGAAISAWAGITGLQSAMVWSSVLVYGLGLLISGYFLASGTRSAQRVA